MEDNNNKFCQLQMSVGELPWKSTIPLQGDGMAAIPKLNVKGCLVLTIFFYMSASYGKNKKSPPPILANAKCCIKTRE